jgi:hypothetical protein
MDNDWLMATAVAKGCILQYTGVENVREVRNIVRKLKSAGSGAYATMWGENAGVESSGRNPIWLAQVITGCCIRGIDFTWASWLFEKDGVTPSRTLPRFAYAVRMIRAFYTKGAYLPPYLPEEVAKRTSPGHWTLQCVAATRLMSSFPNEIKGDDPEIAAVQGGQTQRILLRFPMELIGSGPIYRARLVMRRYRDWGDDKSPAALGIYRMKEHWDSMDATWIHARAGIPWTHPGGTAEDMDRHAYLQGKPGAAWASTVVPPFGKMGDAVEWDVTQLCSRLPSWDNCGMMIVVEGPQSADKSFASPSHPDPEMRPVLYLETAFRDLHPDW